MCIPNFQPWPCIIKLLDFTKSIIICDDGRSSSGSAAFVGDFVLGGLIVGTLGLVYAPQKTHKKLTEKIAHLNNAIDDVSSQLNSDDEESNANGAIVPEKSQFVA